MVNRKRQVPIICLQHPVIDPIQRSNMFCGKPMEQELPGCDAMIECFEANDNFKDFDFCIE